TIAPMGDDPVISLPAVASRSSRPAPNITVTISASYTTQRDSIADRDRVYLPPRQSRNRFRRSRAKGCRPAFRPISPLDPPSARGGSDSASGGWPGQTVSRMAGIALI
ncbi:MAG: hypothetical protein ACOY4T_14190, partial [Pseudomonadota bacterium]